MQRNLSLRRAATAVPRLAGMRRPAGLLQTKNHNVRRICVAMQVLVDKSIVEGRKK